MTASNLNQLQYMCKVCDTFSGVKLPKMFEALDESLKTGKRYEGALLDSINILDLNRMCDKAADLNLGDILDGLFFCAKYGGEIVPLTDKKAKSITNICCGTQKDNLGFVIQDFQRRVILSRKGESK